MSVIHEDAELCRVCGKLRSANAHSEGEHMGQHDFSANLPVHMRYCYQGECEDICKYGDEDCPAKPEQRQAVLYYRTLITSECFPKPNRDGTAWVQQQTVLAHQVMELLSNVYQLISAEAPMLLERSMVGMILATIGNVQQELEKAGFEWMAVHQVVPLDLHAEAVRVARAQIEADPDMPAGVKEDLTALIESEVETETATNTPDKEVGGDSPLFVARDSEVVH